VDGSWAGIDMPDPQIKAIFLFILLIGITIIYLKIYQILFKKI
jgi:hypothetical protein